MINFLVAAFIGVSYIRIVSKKENKRGNYQKPFAINGIFEDVIKASVSKPAETPEKPEKKSEEEE